MAGLKFPYAPLPPEIKLQILMFYTLQLRTAGFMRTGSNRNITDTLETFSHGPGATYDSFRPTVFDLVRLHFPYEAKAIPLQHFRKNARRSALRGWNEAEYEGQSNGGNERACFDSEWADYYSMRSRGYMGTSGQDREEVWWLRYLAFVSNRIEPVVKRINDTYYPEYPNWLYYRMFDLWNLNTQHVARRLQDVQFTLFRHLQGIKMMVDEFASDYACHSYRYALAPLRQLTRYYQKRIESLNVTWADFIRCGAFAICVSHYLTTLNAKELIDLFAPDWYAKRFGIYLGYSLPRGGRWGWRVLTVGVNKECVSLRPVEDATKLDFRTFADRNLYWLMCFDIRDCGEICASVETGAKVHVSDCWGMWSLDRDVIVDDEWIDGIDFFGGGELERLFLV